MTDEPESKEVWIVPGEAWFADAQGLCTRLKADYIQMTDDGELYVGMSGKGEIQLSVALAEEGAQRKTATVVPIK